MRRKKAELSHTKSDRTGFLSSTLPRYDRALYEYVLCANEEIRVGETHLIDPSGRVSSWSPERFARLTDGDDVPPSFDCLFRDRGSYESRSTEYTDLHDCRGERASSGIGERGAKEGRESRAYRRLNELCMRCKVRSKG